MHRSETAKVDKLDNNWQNLNNNNNSPSAFKVATSLRCSNHVNSVHITVTGSESIVSLNVFNISDPSLQQTVWFGFRDKEDHKLTDIYRELGIFTLRHRQDSNPGLHDVKWYILQLSNIISNIFGPLMAFKPKQHSLRRRERVTVIYERKVTRWVINLIPNMISWWCKKHTVCQIYSAFQKVNAVQRIIVMIRLTVYNGFMIDI